MTERQSPRKQRANGVESRRRILDAAVEIAGERGYEGTSIAAVSAKCGLPASSIYWHFENKDDLIAAVIEGSFSAWLDAVELPGEEAGTARERVVQAVREVAKSLVNAPDFLRLGLMLAMERRPKEPRGREKFLQVRGVARTRVTEMVETAFPELDQEQTEHIVTLAIAGADGLFVQYQISDVELDLVEMFESYAHMVMDRAGQLMQVSRKEAP